MGHRVGILTSGGDSPGMNAAIRAVTRSALARGMRVFGIRDGYRGLVEGNIFEMDRHTVSDLSIRGGTILGTARLEEFKLESVQDQAIQQLKKHKIDSLVVIGGDGSYRGAAALTAKGINCIGLPGTIDNDVAGTDYTIGFFTALTTICDAIDKLRDTSSSHHRCSVVEVMGNHCGDLALYAGISCGAEIVITPEKGYDEADILEQLKYYEVMKKKNHAIVILSEKLTNAEILAKKISNATGFAGRSTVLGHIQRGGSPVPFDRILATRMGDYAAELLADGKGGMCVCLVDNDICAKTIEEALTTPKKSRKKLYQMFERLV